jgi:hypothetical protein
LLIFAINQFISAGETKYYNLVGVHINAAVIGDGNIQMIMPLPAYATYWNNVLGLNESYLTDLNQRADDCGFTSYIDEHLVYPPPNDPFSEFVLDGDRGTVLDLVAAERSCRTSQSVLQHLPHR